MFGAIFLIVGVSFVSWLASEHKLVAKKVDKEIALSIAEAGINYYNWHLAHDDSDYTDGHPGDPLNVNGNYGPYVHDYFNNSGQKIGEYSLEITPPEVGSTIVTVTSTGYTTSSPNTKRVLELKTGKKSLTDYSFLSHAGIWVGENEGTSGKVHSNGGIRFDGTANAKITSAKTTYSCSGTGHGCSGIKPGIWGIGGPSSFWEFPVTPVDFTGITIDLSNLETEANNSNTFYSETGSPKGYHITFKADGSYDIFKVTSLETSVKQWDDEANTWDTIQEQIKNETISETRAIPSSGVIFVEGNVWVDGVVNGKVTLVAAKLPDPGWSNRPDIRINGNLTYIARDGNHKLGLMAQRHILVPRYAPNNLTIDGALLAQTGHVYFRDYWNASIKTNIEVYGGIITHEFWTWTWVNGSNVVVDGYQTTNTIYDGSFNYGPPPFFPTTGEYQKISWKEK